MDTNDKLIKTISDFKKSLVGNTIKIHSNDYATVALRIAIARRNLGSDLDLKDQIIFQDEKRVIVQTDGYINGKHVATGIAEEIRSASRINQTSALEVCQTSSWGRCLAAMGLTNDKIASAEEVSGALVASDKKLNVALADLAKVSHVGSYKSWLTNNQKLMQQMKETNPVAYQGFLEKFAKIKNKLETNGVIQNG